MSWYRSTQPFVLDETCYQYDLLAATGTAFVLDFNHSSGKLITGPNPSWCFDPTSSHAALLHG